MMLFKLDAARTTGLKGLINMFRTGEASFVHLIALNVLWLKTK